MKLQKKIGASSEIWQIFIADSSSTTGAGLTGLVFNSAGLTAYYHRDTDTTATAMTLVTMTVGTFTSLGFKEIDATNMPGWYQFCPPNAALAAGAKSVAFHLKGATNMAPLPIEVQLTGVDCDDAVRFGLTALPNAAAEAAGGLYTRGSGAGQINQPANGQIDANTVKVAGTAQTARDLGANIDTTVSSRLASGSYTAPDNATISAIAGYVDTEVAAIKAKTDNLPAAPAATGDIVALLDIANGVETGWTLRQALRLILAALAGKVSGAGTTTVAIRDMADTKDRISATVDASGNRTAITRDVS